MKKKYVIKKNYWIHIALIVLILSIDIYSKKWILKNLYIYEKKNIFSVLNFFHVHNYGIAFSIFSDQGKWQKNFLLTFNIIIIIFIINTFLKLKKKLFSYSLVIAGAIGNLIDRIQYGFVIDFIDFHINNWHFATFNIADSSIFIGILIIIKNNYYR